MMMSSIANRDAALVRRRDRPIASPRARRAMRRAGIDPGLVRGSGPGGRIVEADVLRAVAARPADAPADAPGQPISGPAAIFRAEADVTLLVSLVNEMRAHAPHASAGDFSLAGAIRRAMVLVHGEEEEGGSPHLPERPATNLRSVPGFAPMGTVPFFRPSRALRGGSIAIVDLGAQGVDEAAIRPRGAEAGVLAIGRAGPGPEPPAGQAPARRTLRLTLWADPGALDASAAAGLLGRIVDLVQRPLVLFLERLRS